MGSLILVPALAEYSVYAMAARGDLVSELGPLIHGPAPSGLDGVIDLQTGVYLDGSLVAGVDSHSGVLEEGSTAWNNILAVLTAAPCSWTDPGRCTEGWRSATGG